MKLRLYRNSLRLRLSPADVHTLIQTGIITVATRFPHGEISYAIRLSAENTPPLAQLQNGQIVIQLAAAAARDWAGGNSVAMRHSQPLPGGDALDILIEKDFQCLDPARHQDDAELYPNPLTPARPPR